MNDLSKTDLAKIRENPQNNPRFDLSYFSTSDNLLNSHTNMFPEQEYENKTVKKAKEILGEDYSLEDVKATIASFEYLINKWIQEYEKKVFDGKTIKEILQSL